MSNTMRAAVVGEDKTLSVCDVPKPSAGENELLLRVRACGICGSDLHAVDTNYVPAGTILGHEFAGEVVEIGEGVGDHWQIGDRANGLAVLVCGKCEACRTGNLEQCPEVQLIGLDPRAGGAYSEYVRIGAAEAFKVPESVSDVEAAAVEPLAVGLAAYRDGKVEPGASVLIVGAGPIGASVAQWARYFGAVHIGISDLNEERLKRGGEAGADVLINAAEDPDPVAAFTTRTGVKPKVIFECTGVPGMVSRLVEAAPPKSHLVFAGTGMEADQLRVADAAMKKLRMSFALGYGPKDFKLIIKLLESGRINARSIVTDTIALDQAPAMFETLKKPNSHGKVIIQP